MERPCKSTRWKLQLSLKFKLGHLHPDIHSFSLDLHNFGFSFCCQYRRHRKRAKRGFIGRRWGRPRSKSWRHWSWDWRWDCEGQGYLCISCYRVNSILLSCFNDCYVPLLNDHDQLGRSSSQQRQVRILCRQLVQLQYQNRHAIRLLVSLHCDHVLTKMLPR